MFISPANSFKVIDTRIILSVLLIHTREQVLILLTYLFYVSFEKCPLNIVSVSSSRSVRHLLKRCLFAFDVLSSLEIIQPSQGYYSIYSLLIFQVDILVLIDPSTTPTVHHNLLLLIDSITPFSPWEIVLSWYRIEVYT